MGRSPRERGFTLIELVVVITIIAILAGALVPLLLRPLQNERFSEAADELGALEHAIGGQPALGDFGFLGTLGRLPASDLGELLDPGTLAGPALRRGVARGWNGPYLRSASRAPLVDPWGQAYLLETEVGGQWRLRSGGPDRTAETADDLVAPAEGGYWQSRGTLSVDLLTVRGARQLPLSDDWVASATLHVPDPADASADLALACTPSGGRCTFGSVPFGAHALEVVLTSTAPCPTCTYARTLVLSRPVGTAVVQFELPSDPRPTAFGCTGPDGGTAAPDGGGAAFTTVCSTTLEVPPDASAVIHASGSWRASVGGECVLVLQVDGVPSGATDFSAPGEQGWRPVTTRSAEQTVASTAITTDLSAGSHTFSLLLKANAGTCQLDQAGLSGLLVPR